MITSAYSKSSNPILQKFCEMICEIIVYKMVCRVFLIFCRSSVINKFIVKKHFLDPQNHRNLNISRPIYLKKIRRSALKIISAQISWKNFFSKIFFQGLEAFYTNAKPLIWTSFFPPKKIDFILFSSVII